MTKYSKLQSQSLKIIVKLIACILVSNQTIDVSLFNKHNMSTLIIVTSYYVLQKLKNGTSNQVKMIAMRRDIFSVKGHFQN
jgi:hypothetical protein